MQKCARLAISLFYTLRATEPLSRSDLIRVLGEFPRSIDDTLISKALSEVTNASIASEMKAMVYAMNETFNHSFAFSFLESGEDSTPVYAAASGNPHCDVGGDGPRTVTTIVPAQKTNNPFNNMPKIGFDLTETTNKLLNDATSPGGSSAASGGIVQMVGLMMVKNMVQAAVATGLSVVPPMIPPPVWNLMPLPCVPMVTGSNCFGAVLYPITFADSVIADVTDSVMSGTIRQFRSMFQSRAGPQPDAVYQKCFKSYMSLMCSSLFPMCTNPQGRNEMIPFLGRVPTCFTACLAVLLNCPGFGMADIEGPCAEISIPPICSQAVYLRDDLEGAKSFETEIEGKLNSKCANYDPEIDAGQDPLLYETEAPEKLFHNYHDMQAYIPA